MWGFFIKVTYLSFKSFLVDQSRYEYSLTIYKNLKKELFFYRDICSGGDYDLDAYRSLKQVLSQ